MKIKTVNPMDAYAMSDFVETHQRQARYAPRLPLRYGGHEVLRIVFDPRDLFSANWCGYVVTKGNRVMRFSASSHFHTTTAPQPAPEQH